MKNMYECTLGLLLFFVTYSSYSMIYQTTRQNDKKASWALRKSIAYKKMKHLLDYPTSSWLSSIPGTAAYQLSAMFNELMQAIRSNEISEMLQNRINGFYHQSLAAHLNIINKEDSSGHTLLFYMAKNIFVPDPKNNEIEAAGNSAYFNEKRKVAHSLNKFGARLNDKDKKFLATVFVPAVVEIIERFVFKYSHYLEASQSLFDIYGDGFNYLEQLGVDVKNNISPIKIKNIREAIKGKKRERSDQIKRFQKMSPLYKRSVTI